MVLECRDAFGIPVLCTLTILGAETSLGDPALGGPLVGASNFGCLKYTGTTSSWGKLAEPEPIIVRGVKWYRFQDAETGMRAWATYIKEGAAGAYLPLLTRTGGPDWPRFCAIYYGSAVPGFGEYLANVEAIYARFRARVREHGYEWGAADSSLRSSGP